ncbi:hypothetical protein HYR65_02525, partial [Candidatus Azambacteria bacterium]|nr:hypothetical protein [Candidatus Azambacteria bacterium]
MRINLIGQRVKWLSAIFLFFAAFILARFVDMQILDNKGYINREWGFSRAPLLSRSARGEIFLADRFGMLSPLAVNKSVFTVYTEPRNISNKEEAARVLSDVLSLPLETIKEKISKENDPYEVIAPRVSEDVAGHIKDLGLSGVGVSSQLGRYYPLEELAAHIAGFVGVKGDKKTGQYGIEGFYEKELASEDGSLDKLVLSVDPHAQFKLEEALNNVVKRWDAIGGTAIVMEPSTGRILGMANTP